MNDLITLIESISLFRLFAWGVLFPIVVAVLWRLLQVISLMFRIICYAIGNAKVEGFWD